MVGPKLISNLLIYQYYFFSGSLAVTADGVRVSSRLKSPDGCAAADTSKYSPAGHPADSSSFEVIAPPPNYHQAIDTTSDLCRQDSKEPPTVVREVDFSIKEVSITTQAGKANDQGEG